MSSYFYASVPHTHTHTNTHSPVQYLPESSRLPRGWWQNNTHTWSHSSRACRCAVSGAYVINNNTHYVKNALNDKHTHTHILTHTHTHSHTHSQYTCARPWSTCRLQIVRLGTWFLFMCVCECRVERWTHMCRKCALHQHQKRHAVTHTHSHSFMSTHSLTPTLTLHHSRLTC
jgi:hypothetical protein